MPADQRLDKKKMGVLEYAGNVAAGWMNAMQAWRRTDWPLDEWLIHARAIERRRCGRPREVAVARHVALFPSHLVAAEIDLPVLDGLIELLEGSPLFGRPTRGHRLGHWTTEPIVTARNQWAKLARIGKRNGPWCFPPGSVRGENGQ